MYNVPYMVKSSYIFIHFLLFSEQTLRYWVQKYGWKEMSDGMIFIANQDENIKTKNITEKIDFDSVAGIMANCRWVNCV